MLEDGESLPAEFASFFDDLDDEDDVHDDDAPDLVNRAWDEARICAVPGVLELPASYSRTSDDALVGDSQIESVLSNVKEEGVARIDAALSLPTAATLRTYVLTELRRAIADEEESSSVFSSVLSPRNFDQSDSSSSIDEDEEGAPSFVPPAPTTRWDLRLPLASPVRAALAELLDHRASSSSSGEATSGSSSGVGSGGSSRGVVGAAFEALSTNGLDAEVWELAALVSVPGAAPQAVHSDTVWSKDPCLVTCFVALQDVTSAMGPTRFFPGTHTKAAHKAFAQGANGAEFLPSKRCMDALLPAGACSLYDGRLLHCGTANNYNNAESTATMGRGGEVGGGGDEVGDEVGGEEGQWLSKHARVLFYVTLKVSGDGDEEAMEEVANEAAHSILPEFRGENALRLGRFRRQMSTSTTATATTTSATTTMSTASAQASAADDENDDDDEDDDAGFHFSVPAMYDYTRSTEENYATETQSTQQQQQQQQGDDGVDASSAFFGPYKQQRASLDLSYHKAAWSRERQCLQDEIVAHFLDHAAAKHDLTQRCRSHNQVRDSGSGSIISCSIVGSSGGGEGPEQTEASAPSTTTTSSTTTATPPPPSLWVVVTAGAMGAGKSRCMRWLAEKGFFPLDDIVQVDPDAIRHMLPETNGYLARDRTTAGARTQKEAGLVQELLTLEALSQGRSVLIDGSLRNQKYYGALFQRIRNDFSHLSHQGGRHGFRLALLHVTCSPPEEVLKRATKRAQTTGRAVPTEVRGLHVNLSTSLVTTSPHGS